MNGFMPRADVGGGGLAGALMVVFLLVLDRTRAFDFNVLVAALTVIFVFSAGYLPGRLKSLLMAVAAFLAVLVAAAVGSLFFGQAADAFLVSAALSGLITALVAYVGPPRDPEEPGAVEVVIEEEPKSA